MKKLILFICLLFSLILPGQDPLLDSLKNVQKTDSSDSVKVMAMYSIFDLYQRDYKLNECKEVAAEAIRVADKSKIRSVIGVANLMMGIHNKDIEEYPTALKHLSIALLNLHPQANKKLLGDANSYTGFIQEQMGEYAKAINYHRTALKLRSEIHERLGCNSLMRLAGSFSNLKMSDSAFYYFYKGIGLARKYDIKRSLSGLYNNLGIAYDDLHRPDSALVYYLKAYALLSEFKDSVAMAGTLINIGGAYTVQHKLDKAIVYYKQGIDLAKKMRFKQWIANGTKDIADVYYLQKEYKLAYEYFKLSKEYADSVLNESKQAEIANAEEKYQSEKKQQELEIAGLKINSQQTELHAGQTQRNMLLIGLVIVFIAGGIVLFVYFNNKKLTRELFLKNKEIERKNAMIEERNKDITDSIIYAKRIQRSQMPTEFSIKKELDRLMKKN